MKSHAIATKYKRILNTNEQAIAFEQFFALKKLLLNFNLLYLNLETRKGIGAIANIKKGIDILRERYPEYKKEIKQGLAAKDKLILHNYRMVVGEAHRHDNQNIAEEDLMGAGTEGLTYALFKFNPGVQIKFSSYAYFWVKEFIREAIRKKDLICHPAKSDAPKYLITSLSKADDDYHDIFETAIAENETGLVDDLLSHLSDAEIAAIYRGDDITAICDRLKQFYLD
jgi:RNA polymerase sigma factor (sigma-70 family)